MQINRDSFLKALKFLKPAIHHDPQDILNRIHVFIKAERCQLTASNHLIGKRVIIERENTVEDYIESIQESELMIPKSVIESFETLCLKHRARFLNSGKRDPSIKLIDINDEKLTSHKNFITYSQPSSQKKYPNIDHYFDPSYWHQAESYEQKFKACPQNIIDTLREFSANVNIFIPGGKAPVLIEEDKNDILFMAFFMPVSKNKNKKKNLSQQLSF